MAKITWKTIPRPKRPLSTGSRPWKYKALADDVAKTAENGQSIEVTLNGIQVYRLQATLRANLVKKALRLRYFQEDGHIVAWAEEMVIPGEEMEDGNA